MGLGWVAYRGYYSAAKRLGLLRLRMPARPWSELPLRSFLRDPALADPAAYLEYRRKSAPRFFFSPADRERYQQLLAQWDTPECNPVSEAEEILLGRLRYFHYHTVDTGLPPDWHRNAFTGDTVPADRHWSELDSAEYGDIKVVWEPSRFGFAFTLVRAYWRTGDERYAECFWKLFEDWCQRNPPNLGPAWMCGQEVGFRVMAWCFALYGLLDSPASTPERVAKLAQAVAVSGERIRANLAYALSQRQNHAISEPVGLMTIGMLFPELRAASAWLQLGVRQFCRQVRQLVYSDGVFSQRSTNYHRLMLHDCIWAWQLCKRNAVSLSRAVRARITVAVGFLRGLVDPQSGGAPLSGCSDGSVILPLSNCGYSDFRPVTQAALYCSSRRRALEAGPWDEDLLWLFGTEALHAPVEHVAPACIAAPVGGYYGRRTGDSFALVHCPTRFIHRPAHADLLHVDLWWRGQSICADAGTLSYSSPPTGDDPLAVGYCHNTVTVDGLDQMTRVSQFLWLPWPRGRPVALWHSPGGRIWCAEFETEAYSRLRPPVAHRRVMLSLGEGTWVVLDRLMTDRPRSYRLHWLLADLPYVWDPEDGQLVLSSGVSAYRLKIGASAVPTTTTVVRADPDSLRGWRAPHYFSRHPAVSVELIATARNTVLWSVFSPHHISVSWSTGALDVRWGAWECQLKTQCGSEQGRLLTALRLRRSPERRA